MKQSVCHWLCQCVPPPPLTLPTPFHVKRFECHCWLAQQCLPPVKTEQWDKAEADLIKGEELNAGAHTMKLARAMYMDAVHPVAPEIEIDDRDKEDANESDPD